MAEREKSPSKKTASREDQLVGTRIGGVKLEKLLGRGAMGAVFLGLQESLERKVAVKVLSSAPLNEEASAERFFKEARAAARINHPNVVQVYDAGIADETPYIIMELVEGEGLGRRIKRQGKLGHLEAVDLMIGATRGLTAAHERGLIHRDIKPDNILISTDGTPKLADFGLTKDLSSGTSDMTLAGHLLGTPNYMSPEACSGSPLDSRSDLYSLGVTLFLAVTGKLPFKATSLHGLLLEHLTKKPPDPTSIDPTIPKGLETLILKLLEKEPENRLPSAQRMVEELLYLRDDCSPDGSAPPFADPDVGKGDPLAVSEQKQKPEKAKDAKKPPTPNFPPPAPPAAGRGRVAAPAPPAKPSEKVSFDDPRLTGPAAPAPPSSAEPAPPPVASGSEETERQRRRDETERKTREEAEWQARREEAEGRAREEAERRARREETERRTQEETERQARREETERRTREETERQARREETERRTREETERQARREETERKTREEAERRERAEDEPAPAPGGRTAAPAPPRANPAFDDPRLAAPRPPAPPPPPVSRPPASPPPPAASRRRSPELSFEPLAPEAAAAPLEPVAPEPLAPAPEPLPSGPAAADDLTASPELDPSATTAAPPEGPHEARITPEAAIDTGGTAIMPPELVAEVEAASATPVAPAAAREEAPAPEPSDAARSPRRSAPGGAADSGRSPPGRQVAPAESGRSPPHRQARAEDVFEELSPEALAELDHVRQLLGELSVVGAEPPRPETDPDAATEAPGAGRARGSTVPGAETADEPVPGREALTGLTAASLASRGTPPSGAGVSPKPAPPGAGALSGPLAPERGEQRVARSPVSQYAKPPLMSAHLPPQASGVRPAAPPAGGGRPAPVPAPVAARPAPPAAGPPAPGRAAPDPSLRTGARPVAPMPPGDLFSDSQPLPVPGVAPRPASAPSDDRTPTPPQARSTAVPGAARAPGAPAPGAAAGFGVPPETRRVAPPTVRLPAPGAPPPPVHAPGSAAGPGAPVRATSPGMPAAPAAASRTTASGMPIAPPGLAGPRPGPTAGASPLQRLETQRYGPPGAPQHAPPAAAPYDAFASMAGCAPSTMQPTVPESDAARTGASLDPLGPSSTAAAARSRAPPGAPPPPPGGRAPARSPAPGFLPGMAASDSGVLPVMPGPAPEPPPARQPGRRTSDDTPVLVVGGQSVGAPPQRRETPPPVPTPGQPPPRGPAREQPRAGVHAALSSEARRTGPMPAHPDVGFRAEDDRPLELDREAHRRDRYAPPPPERKSASFQQARDDAPPLPGLSVEELMLRAKLHYSRSKWADAERDYRRVVQLDASHAIAHFALACVLARQDKVAPSLEHLDRSIALGFRDRNKITSAQDLSRLHNQARFRSLLAKLR